MLLADTGLEARPAMAELGAGAAIGYKWSFARGVAGYGADLRTGAVCGHAESHGCDYEQSRGAAMGHASCV